jgi:CubicO group peptidase (beta-lactamase class C family)
MDLSGLDAFLDDQDFAGVVLLTQGERTVFESATGLASRRWDIPNTLETRFDSSSITKLFTAVAVLQQVSAGELDLETSIHHYVDLDGTTIGSGVTLLHLLTHTSGIADDVEEEDGEDYAELFRDVPAYGFTETRDYLRLFANKPPRAEPGVITSYCNAGYLLAGLALERATGVSYRQYVFDEVFTRARMTHAGFYDRREAAPRIAEGWDLVDGQWVDSVFTRPPIGAPDAGAHVTAHDLTRFFQAIRGGELLDREYTEEFLLPQVELDADEGTMYGLGLEFDLDEDGGVRSYYADGLATGASGILRHYVADELDVVVLSNSEEGAWPVIRELDERLGG